MKIRGETKGERRWPDPTNYNNYYCLLLLTITTTYYINHTTTSTYYYHRICPYVGRLIKKRKPRSFYIYINKPKKKTKHEMESIFYLLSYRRSAPSVLTRVGPRAMRHAPIDFSMSSCALRFASPIVPRIVPGEAARLNLRPCPDGEQTATLVEV